MKKKPTFFLTIIFILNSTFALAQYTNNQKDDQPDAASGMEAKKVNNDVTILMPKDAKMYKRNKSTYVEESSDSYAARNFATVENRLNNLEKEDRELREEISDIRSRLNTAEKNADKNAPDVNKE